MLRPLQGTGTATACVADAIIAAADAVDADVLVMSTHALTGPARVLLGSVADAIVRTARQPVLLLRRAVAVASPGTASDGETRQTPRASGGAAK